MQGSINMFSEAELHLAYKVGNAPPNLFTYPHFYVQEVGPFIEQRFGNDSNLQLYDEALLVQDITNYALGPHSDAPRKVITLLFSF